MVERIKIQSNSIIVRDSSNNITFDTANSYIKTASDGVMSVGGNAKFTVYNTDIGSNYNFSTLQQNEGLLEYFRLYSGYTRINNTINLGVLPAFIELRLLYQPNHALGISKDYYYSIGSTTNNVNVRVDNVIVGQGYWECLWGIPYDGPDSPGYYYSGYVTDFVATMPSNRIGGTVTIDAATSFSVVGYTRSPNYVTSTFAHVTSNLLESSLGTHRVLIAQPSVNLALKVTP